MNESRVILSLEEFIGWLDSIESLNTSQGSITGTTPLVELFGEDFYVRFRFGLEFDKLTSKDGARPSLDLFNSDSVGALYLHYLYLMSAPIEESGGP